jgi:hypothetical protein
MPLKKKISHEVLHKRKSHIQAPAFEPSKIERVNTYYPLTDYQVRANSQPHQTQFF